MINRNKKIAMSVVRAVLLAIFLIAALLPLYWIFVTSIKAGTEIYTFPLKYWPDKPSFDSYKELFSFSNFGMYFRNSLLISLSAAFGAMVISILSGFKAYHKETEGSNRAWNVFHSDNPYIHHHGADLHDFLLLPPYQQPHRAWLCICRNGCCILHGHGKELL